MAEQLSRGVRVIAVLLAIGLAAVVALAAFAFGDDEHHGNAQWRLADGFDLTQATTSVEVLVSDPGGCQVLHNEVLPPDIVYGQTDVHITLPLGPPFEAIDPCLLPATMTIVLDEPLGRPGLVGGASLPGLPTATPAPTPGG